MRDITRQLIPFVIGSVVQTQVLEPPVINSQGPVTVNRFSQKGRRRRAKQNASNSGRRVR